MKPYAMRYITNADELKNTNIKDVGSYVWTPYLNIKSEYRDDFEIWDDEEYANVEVPYIHINELLNDPLNYDWNMGAWFDEFEYGDYLGSLIKFANHYLVCAYSCTWDRRTGYKFVDELEDAFYRDYDCTQYYSGGSRGGKAITINEYSHDVPMGHTTMIIALTDKEYDRLTLCENFDTVIKFASKFSDSIIEI